MNLKTDLINQFCNYTKYILWPQNLFIYLFFFFALLKLLLIRSKCNTQYYNLFMFVPPKQAEKAAAMKDKQLNDLLARMMQYERVRSYSPIIEVNWILRYHLLV